MAGKSRNTRNDFQSQGEAQRGAQASPDEPFRHIVEREAQGIRPGGFGILMAKKLVDDLLYTQQGNEVLLIKHLNKSDQ
jgi:anti-sigma regulatory factor (Ser/Thr protein kinase)